jgi:arylsulfatase A-like enzyme
MNMNGRKNWLAKAFTVALFLAVAALLLSLVSRTEGDKRKRDEKKPSIILMSIDTLRADHLRCYGYNRDTSPSIDRFAGESVLFENAITQGAKTASAHMSIFTGVTPMAHGVGNITNEGDYRALPETFATLPEVLKINGYLTVGFTGGGNVAGYLGFERGFDLYSKDIIKWHGLYRDAESLENIRQWIQKSKQEEKPLFLFLHHYLCHEPYLKGPNRMRLRFLQEQAEGLPTEPNDIGPSREYAARRNKFWEKVDLKNPRHREHIVALYDGGVLYADYVFEKVIRILKEEAIYDDSLILLVSDHGEEFSEHGGRSHGQLFVESIHVPLIIRLPHGEHAGKRVVNSVRTMDLMPTLLDIAGIESKRHMQGISFLPLLAERGKYAPELFSYSDDSEHIRYQKGTIVYIEQPLKPDDEWLCDYSSDPAEQANLAGLKPKDLQRMKDAAKGLMKADRKLREESEKLIQ